MELLGTLLYPTGFTVEQLNFAILKPCGIRKGTLKSNRFFVFAGHYGIVVLLALSKKSGKHGPI